MAQKRVHELSNIEILWLSIKAFFMTRFRLSPWSFYRSMQEIKQLMLNKVNARKRVS